MAQGIGVYLWGWQVGECKVMRNTSTGAVLLSLLVSACATPGPRTAGIAFVQGCWVQQKGPGGEAEASLSLLPNAKDAVYAGGLATMVGAAPMSQSSVWPTSVSYVGPISLSFSDEGAATFMSATMLTDDGATLYGHNTYARDYATGSHPNERSHLAVFRSVENSDGTLMVEAGNDRLKISRTAAQGPQNTLFDGERTTCD